MLSHPSTFTSCSMSTATAVPIVGKNKKVSLRSLLQFSLSKPWPEPYVEGHDQYLFLWYLQSDAHMKYIYVRETFSK